MSSTASDIEKELCEHMNVSNLNTEASLNSHFLYVPLLYLSVAKFSDQIILCRTDGYVTIMCELHLLKGFSIICALKLMIHFVSSNFPSQEQISNLMCSL